MRHTKIKDKVSEIGKFIDKSGSKIGRLTVIGRAEDSVSQTGIKRTMWTCRCDCGNVVTVRGDSLNGRHTLSCGCLQKEVVALVAADTCKKRTITGESKGRLYNIWYLMKYRCENPKSPAFYNYGGRGIKVCDEWSDERVGYIKFRDWAVANGYNDKLTIDRKDNNGCYSPDNCRWVTTAIQNSNKRSNRAIEYMGETKNLSQWAEFFGIEMKTLHRRLSLGWSFEDAVSKSVR